MLGWYCRFAISKICLSRSRRTCSLYLMCFRFALLCVYRVSSSLASSHSILSQVYSKPHHTSLEALHIILFVTALFAHIVILATERPLHHAYFHHFSKSASFGMLRFIPQAALELTALVVISRTSLPFISPRAPLMCCRLRPCNPWSCNDFRCFRIPTPKEHRLWLASPLCHRWLQRRHNWRNNVFFAYPRGE